MRAIEAKIFSGYDGLRQIELPKPQPAKGRVLVRVTAAGVTPHEYTLLSGGHPRAKAPLVLGTQGAGKVISTAGSAAKAARARELGFEDVIDLTEEGLADGVRRITAGKGVDIVIES